MKRLLLLGLLVPFLLIVGTGMYNLVGMASTSPLSYTCTDNDVFSSNPINSRGIVIVASSAGERNVYTDGCLDINTVREYSCDSLTSQQIYLDQSCPDGRVCKLGRCMAK